MSIQVNALYSRFNEDMLQMPLAKDPYGLPSEYFIGKMTTRARLCLDVTTVIRYIIAPTPLFIIRFFV
jgi:hypothetical protein